MRGVDFFHPDPFLSPDSKSKPALSIMRIYSKYHEDIPQFDFANHLVLIVTWWANWQKEPFKTLATIVVF
jgi:hypothetical protein